MSGEGMPDAARQSAPRFARSRRVVRRLARLLVFAVLIVLAARIGLGLALPTILRKVAGDHGFRLELDGVSISLLRGELELRGLSLSSLETGEPVLDAEYVRAIIDLPSLMGARIRFRRAEIDGMDGVLEREEDGRLALARWVSEADLPDEGALGEPDEEPPAAAPTVASSRIDWLLPVRFDALRLHGARVRVRDRSVSPPVDVSVRLDVRATDVQSPDRPSRVSVMLSAPPVLEELEVHIDGPYDERALDLTFDLAVRGAAPEPLAGYLRPAGVELGPEPVSLELQGEVRGLNSSAKPRTISGSAVLRELSVERGGTRSLSVNEVSCDLSEIGDGIVDVSGVRLVGLRGAVHRNDSGAIHVGGLDVVGTSRSRGETPGETRPPTPAAVSSDERPDGLTELRDSAQKSGARWRVQTVAVRDARIALRDEAVSPPSSVLVEVPRVDVSGFDSSAEEPASLSLEMQAPGAFEHLQLEGALAVVGAKLTVDVSLAARDVTLEALRGHLDPSGSGPVVDHGGVRVRLRGDAAFREDGGLRVDLVASDLDVSAGDERLTLGSIEATSVDFALDGESHGAEAIVLAGATLERNGAPAARIERLSIDAPRISDEMLHARTVEVTKPYVRLSRTARGSVLFGEDVAHATATESWAVSRRSSSADPRAQGGAAAAAPPDGELGLRVDELRVIEGTVRWSDRAVAPGVESLDARVDLDVEDLGIGEGADRSTIRMKLVVPGAIDELRATGSIQPSFERPEAELEVTASGVTAGTVASYLPGGRALELEEGHARFIIDVGLAPNDAGGYRGRLAVRELECADKPGERVLARAEGIEAVLSRLDLPGGVVALQSLSLAGLEGRVERDADGSFEILGMRFGTRIGAPTGGEPAANLETASVVLASARDDRTRALSAAAPSSRNVPSGDALRSSVPLVSTEELQVDIRRLSLHDASRPGAEAVAVNGLRIENLAPIELFGDDPANRPPIRLRLEGAIPSAVDSLLLDVEALPFVQEPRAAIDVRLKGLHDGLARTLMEGFDDAVRFEELEGGELRVWVEAALREGRRRRRVPGLARDLGVNVTVRDLEITSGADGTLLAGVEEMRFEAPEVDLARSNVRMRVAEVNGVRGDIEYAPDGVHTLGVVFLDETPAEPSSDEASSAPSSPPKPPDSRPQPLEASPPGLEFEIEDFLLTDVRLRYTHSTLSPPVEIPLDDVDLRVSGLGTGAFRDGEPLEFDAYLLGGAVDLPKRHPVSGIVLGAIGMAVDTVTSVASVFTSSEAEANVELEERPLFSDARLKGRVGMLSSSEGWLETRVSGLELAGLRGLGQAVGFQVWDGLLDSSGWWDFGAEGATTVDSRVRLTGLVLTEPADGPIARFLSLPVSLQTAVEVLQDRNGAIALPISIRSQDRSFDVVLRLIGDALRSIVLRSLKRAPLRVVLEVTDIARPLGQLVGVESEDHQPALEDVPVEFDACSVVIGGEAAQAVSGLVDALEKDAGLSLVIRHVLGSDDLECAARLTSPTRGDRLGMARHLRNRIGELVHSREVLLGQIFSSVMVGSETAWSTSRERIAELDRELGRLERALDETLNSLERTSEQTVRRRMREATVELGARRLAAVRAALLDLGGEELDARVRSIRPRPSDPGNGPGRVVFQILRGRGRL